MFFELTPAYGRDYKTKKEVVEAFTSNRDFEGDYQLGFKLVNRAQLTAIGGKGATVLLRYKRNTQVASVKL